MLRGALLAFGLLLLVLAAWLSAKGAAAAIGPALIGALITLGLLLERHVYKPLEDGSPGPEWRRTGERFVDPASGETVTVFVRPGTGERRYVRGGPPPAGPG